MAITVLSVLASAQFFLDPVDALFPLSSIDRARTTVFVIVGLLVSVLSVAVYGAAVEPLPNDVPPLVGVRVPNLSLQVPGFTVL